MKITKNQIKQIILDNIHSCEQSIDRITTGWNTMWEAMNNTFFSSQDNQDNNQMIIHKDFRSSQSWYSILSMWENFQVTLKENTSYIRNLCNNVDSLDVNMNNKSHFTEILQFA